MQVASDANFYYAVHGLHVAVNHSLSALTPAPATDRPDLRIWMGPMAELCQRNPAIDLARPASNTPIMLVRQSTSHGQEMIVQRVNDPNLTMIAILAASGDVVEVGWQGGGQLVPDEVENVIANYFMAVWLGMALRLSGRLILHGNVVTVNDRAVAWLGAKGAGKSTLTAAFVAAGYPLLSDDQIVPWLEPDTVSVAHGIMRLHLWPASLAVMTPVQDSYTFDQPFGVYPKGYVSVAPPTMAETRTPLRGIYVLQPRQVGITSPKIETPSPGEAFQLLYTHCLARRTMPLTAAGRRAEFYAVAELHRRVPVRLLTLPDDLARVADAVQILVEECVDE